MVPIKTIDVMLQVIIQTDLLRLEKCRIIWEELDDLFNFHCRTNRCFPLKKRQMTEETGGQIAPTVKHRMSPSC